MLILMLDMICDAKVGENHRRSTATNVIEYEEGCKNWTLFMRGLIKGDTLLSLLFCLAILSLAHALKKQNGYRIRHSTVKSSIIHKI